MTPVAHAVNGNKPNIKRKLKEIGVYARSWP